MCAAAQPPEGLGIEFDIIAYEADRRASANSEQVSLILAAKHVAGGGSFAPVKLRETTMRNTLFALAATLAIGAGFFMMAAPETTQAATPQGLDIYQLTQSTPKDLPSFDDKYQRHLGVLDVLKH